MTRCSTIVALLALAGLVACSRSDENELTSDSAGGVAADSPSTPEDSATASNDAEVATIRELADRDEALLEMARTAVNRREQLAVSADAHRLLSDIRQESNRLHGLLRGDLRVTHRARISESDQALVDSVKASGVGEFDRIFLGVVALHHEGDVTLIDAALPKITVPKVRETLTAIRAQRAAEAAAFKKRPTAAPSGR
jgi:uncharacterized protein (DUF305 family)